MAASLLMALSLVVAGVPAQPDAFATALPDGLKVAALRHYPGAHLPMQSDNLAEDIKYHREHGGSGCLGVAKGSFTGRGKRDFAFLLTEKDKVWLVMATSDAGTWRFEKVGEPGSSDFRMRL